MQLLMNDLAFIGLGTNIGDGLENLKTAVQQLESFIHTSILASSVYRSEPVEVTDQPWFYNQVVGFALEQSIGPLKLLQKLKEIEVSMGRTPGPRYGPRVIDLDLLLYKNWVYECDCLRIPHPKMENRSFVLQPLAEIAPELEHPYLHRKIGEILEQKKLELTFCEKIALKNLN